MRRSWICQEDGARIMAAHEKVLEHMRVLMNLRGQHDTIDTLASLGAAGKAFAELVAELTVSEGL